MLKVPLSKIFVYIQMCPNLFDNTLLVGPLMASQSVNKFLSLFLSLSVVRAFAHGVMGHRIDPSWDGPIELFLVPASAPQLV